jgi:hypothetical protein
VQFGELSLDEEAHLVRAIFSRADAWLSADARHRPDRPLRTLATIGRIGFAGVGRALSLTLKPARRRPRLATRTEERPPPAPKASRPEHPIRREA